MKKANRLLKNAALLGVTVGITLASTMISQAGTWKQDANGWWYENEDKSYPINSWIFKNNKWYHFNTFGYMETGWIQDNGKFYYLGNDGAMLANAITPDGYTVGADGAWIVNDKTEENKKAREAFYKHLADNEGEDNARCFALIDVNQDGIDELVTGQYSFWRGAYYYAYVDGNLVEWEIWGDDGVYYRPDVKALVTDRFHNGNGEYTVTTLVDGEWNTEFADMTHCDVLEYFEKKLSIEEFNKEMSLYYSTSSFTYEEYLEQWKRLHELNNKYNLLAHENSYITEIENTAVNRLKLLEDF